MHLRIAQTAPRRGDRPHNAAAVAAAARDAARAGADLLVLPELSLTGYDLGGRVTDLARGVGEGPGVELPPDGPTVVTSEPERGEDHLIYNSASAWRGSRLLHTHRKLYLPTYGGFDEGRLFARGASVGTFLVPAPDGRAWRVGILVCEDLWHPALVWLAALQGADLLVVPSAAPGHGSSGDGGFANAGRWELLARTAAVQHGLYLALANRVGVEGGLVFRGGSLVVAPDGEVLARGEEEGEAVIDATLDLAEVRRARRTFSHLRDEDPALVAREIERVLARRAHRGEP